MSPLQIRRSKAPSTPPPGDSTGAPTVTSLADREVNLVPKLVRDTIAVRHVRKAFGWLIVLVIAGIAALWLLQVGPISTAQARLDEAQSQSISLGAKVKALAPIGQLYTLLTDQEAFITGAVASQVRVADIQTALQRDAGPNVRFTNLALTNTGIPQPGAASDTSTACPDADPFTTDLVVGCVSFTATGGSRDDVSAFLEKAASDPLFVNPYVTTTTMGESAEGGFQVTFSGSTGLSLGALTTPMSDKDIEALRQAMDAAAQAAANPSPSASPSAAAGGATP